jgi:predicted component of type VI protein secretion system
MNRRGCCVLLAGALGMLVVGCDATTQSATGVAEQLQAFVGDFLRNALAAYLI